MTNARKLLQAEAGLMRYCGFNCRADYKKMVLVVKGAPASEVEGFKALGDKSGIRSTVVFN